MYLVRDRGWVSTWTKGCGPSTRSPELGRGFTFLMSPPSALSSSPRGRETPELWLRSPAQGHPRSWEGEPGMTSDAPRRSSRSWHSNLGDDGALPPPELGSGVPCVGTEGRRGVRIVQEQAPQSGLAREPYVEQRSSLNQEKGVLHL